MVLGRLLTSMVLLAVGTAAAEPMPSEDNRTSEQIWQEESEKVWQRLAEWEKKWGIGTLDRLPSPDWHEMEDLYTQLHKLRSKYAPRKTRTNLERYGAKECDWEFLAGPPPALRAAAHLEDTERWEQLKNQILMRQKPDRQQDFANQRRKLSILSESKDGCTTAEADCKRLRIQAQANSMREVTLQTPLPSSAASYAQELVHEWRETRSGETVKNDGSCPLCWQWVKQPCASTDAALRKEPFRAGSAALETSTCPECSQTLQYCPLRSALLSDWEVAEASSAQFCLMRSAQAQTYSESLRYRDRNGKPRNPDDIVGGPLYEFRTRMGKYPLTYAQLWARSPFRLPGNLRYLTREEALDPTTEWDLDIETDWSFNILSLEGVAEAWGLPRGKWRPRIYDEKSEAYIDIDAEPCNFKG